MKNYIFLNTSIANIGGAELYISHKCSHLKNLGYNVYVFSFEHGNVVINNLKEYEKYILPELKVLFRRSNARMRRNVLDAFINLNLEGEIIIESNIDNLNPWGEFIAKEIGAYHICYLLPEKSIAREADHEFYRFKYNQHALFGITPRSVTDMMKDGHEYSDSFLPAVGCTSDTIDYQTQYEIEGWKTADYTIMALGRLNKAYIPNMLDSVCAFSRKQKHKSVNLIVIGGFMSASITNHLSKIHCLSPNLQVYYIGEMNPIPQNLFKISDVAIAVAGCAHICYRQGLPVITIDANDHKGIGVFKQFTTNTIFREDEPIVEVENLLYEVLVDKKYGKHTVDSFSSQQQIDYSKHDSLLEIPLGFEYYNVSSRPESFISLIVKLTIHVIGERRYYSFLNMFK